MNHPTWHAPLKASDITPDPWQALMVAGQACVIELRQRSQVAGYMRPADAVLMAAAPDLLAVAEEFMRLWQDGFENEVAHERLARQAEAALAKAKGSPYVPSLG